MKYLWLIGVLIVICGGVFLVLFKRTPNIDVIKGITSSTEKPERDKNIIAPFDTHKYIQSAPVTKDAPISPAENIDPLKCYNAYKELISAKHDFESLGAYYRSISTQSRDFSRMIWNSSDSFFCYFDFLCNDFYDIQEILWRDFTNVHEINYSLLGNNDFLSKLIEKGLCHESKYVRELTATLLYQSTVASKEPTLTDFDLNKIMDTAINESEHPVLTNLMQTLSVYQETNANVNEFFLDTVTHESSNKYDLQTALRTGYAYKYLAPGALLDEKEMADIWDEMIFNKDLASEGDLNSIWSSLQSVWYQEFINRPENFGEKNELNALLKEIINNNVNNFENFMEIWFKYENDNDIIADMLIKYSQEELYGLTQRNIATYVSKNWHINSGLRETYLDILLNMLKANNEHLSRSQTGTQSIMQSILSIIDGQEITANTHARITGTIYESYTPWPATQKIKDAILEKINQK